MAVLFTAIDLPIDVRERLGTLLPAGPPGLRVVRPEEMHVTLHYIGEGEVGVYESALSQVHAGSFAVSLGGPGCFRHGRGASVLWMGVQPSEGLSRLHRAVGAALAAAGCRIDERPFTPHVTLARARSSIPETVGERFLASDTGVWPMMQVTEFILYSSQRVEGRTRYVPERKFSLRRGDCA